MDDQSCLKLVSRLGPKLYRFFLAQGGACEAEEAVQEVFARLLERIDAKAFDQNLGPLDSYAWGIAVNLRREKARVRGFEVLDPDADIMDTDRLPTAVSENLEAMKKAIGNLEDPEKTVLQLVLAGLQISEIGHALNIPDGTVKSHIHRSKEQVREILKKWGIL